MHELTAQIIVYLVDNGEGSPYDIAKAIGAPYTSVYRAMERMASKGILISRSTRGKHNVLKRYYRLSDSNEIDPLVSRAIEIVDKRYGYNSKVVHSGE